jgi:DNA ligase (NAD+)
MLTKEQIKNATSVQLDAFIRKSARSYYEGNPIVPDDIFDYAIEILKVKDPTSPLPYSVGFGYEVDGTKLPHRVQTGSLPKTHSLDNIPDDVYATPKFDGISAVIYFNRNGNLDSVLSRGGDSAQGEPIAHNLLYFLNKTGLNKMPTEVTAISGEIVVKISSFLKSLAQPDGPYALPRSASAGIARTQYLHEFNQSLEFMPFRIHFRDGSHAAIKDEQSTKKFLNYCKVEVPYVKVDQTTTVEDLHEWVKKFDYPTDGVVLWDDVALKFPTEAKETVIKKIIWNTPKSGNLIPVAYFDTVKLYGTNVSKCTLVNGTWVRQHKLGTGAKISVTKANEIIPQFLENLEEVTPEIPTTCPLCGGPTQWGLNSWDKDHITCKNKCAVEKFRIFNFVFHHAALLGYANSTLSKILDENNIKTFDDLLEKLGELESVNLTDHEQKFLDHVNTKFKGKLASAKLLESLNLQGLGSEWSTKLAPHVISYLHNGNGFPFTVNTNIIQAINDNRSLILKVYNRFNWSDDSSNGHLIPVTITGSLSMKKSDFCQKFGLVQVPIGKAEFLITADVNSTSNKMTEARKRGVKVMTERDFIAGRNV